MDSFEKFIVENGNADTVRLVMACKEWPVPEDAELAELDAKSLAVNTIEGRRRLRKKLPEWVACTGLVYPSSLCAEQCSSSDTARYKASIVQRIFNEYVGTVASMVGAPCRTTGSATKGTESVPDKNSPTTRNQSVTELAEVTIPSRGKVADLTGGLGVDSWAFSEVAEEVLYNEMNPALAAAARHNFKALGVTNIFIKNSEATSDSLKDIFGDFRPDVIFLDPARRDSAGKKVFLLEDCSPDVLKILPELFGISRFVLLKLSPMADITMAVERLDRTYEEYLEKASGKGWNGQWVREVHVVASGGECKELLILLDGEWNEGYSLTCREDGKTLTFKPEEITKAKAGYPDSTFARIIFEPGKSLTKAGVSNAICERFGLVKLARFTHLYTISEPLSDSESEQRTAPLKDFGKVFYVKEILPLNKSSMKDVGKRYPHSEVSAKNIPMSSDELRTRLKVKSGDDAHIFGVRIETPYNEDNYLIVTEPSGHGAC
uniref:THUMP-like domain-containing protein n=1 Tax=Candidatus Cryptobacteroides bacterium TaxID=3085639 RepID=UPI004027DB83